MKKLYIVEGIPGVGKTTFATNLAKALREKYGKDTVHLYVEGDLHPADMAWSALLTKNEFDKVCEENPDYCVKIKENAVTWKEYYIVAYTKIPNLSEQLFAYFESKEVYDNRVPQEVFCQVHEDRWKQFGKCAEGIVIFECVLLQNAINELLLFHQASEVQLGKYVQRLLAGVKEMDPEILYLDIQPEAAIERAARERVDEAGNRVWESRVAEYVCDSPYGKAHGYQGAAGMLQYFTQRQELEKQILQSLPVKSCLLPITITNQEEQAKQYIAELVNSGQK